jgi:hypothetical protein
MRPGSRRTATWTLLIALLPALALASERGQALERQREALDGAERARSDEHYARARTLYLEVLDASAEAPSLPRARALDGLADIERERGRPAEAADLYRRSAALWERLLGPEQPRLAVTLHNLGVVEAARSRPDLARAPLERALAIWNRAYGADSRQSANTRRLLERLPRGAERE